MMWMDLWAPLALGLVSSLHCAQMCGPLVLSYSLKGGGGMRSHLCYNAGRIATYTALGALAGAAGLLVTSLGRLAGIAQAASLAAGVCLIVAAIVASDLLRRGTLVRIGSGSWLSYPSRVAAKLLASSVPASRLLLGAVMGLLPCGLVYAALLKAMTADGAAGGALTMALFGAATSIPLLALGSFASFLGARLGRWSNALTAVSMLLMGTAMLWHGFKPVTIGLSCHH